MNAADQNSLPIQAGSLRTGLIGRAKDADTALSPTMNYPDRSWLRRAIS
jgi:hypothetical protein